MTLDASMTSAACLRCALIHLGRAADPVHCPRCGYSIGRARYLALETYAYEAGRFGYQYRRRFETDLAADPSSRRRYLLPEAGELLTFAGLAVLSGVVGGASWDLCKAAIRHFIEQGDPSEPEEAVTLRLELGGEGLERFVNYLRDYDQGVLGETPEVVEAVLEERTVDRLTARLPSPSPPDFDGRAFLNENLPKVLGLDRPSTSDLEGAWSDLPADEDDESSA